MTSFFRRQPELERRSAPDLNDCDLEAQIKSRHERATTDTDTSRNLKTGTWTATRDGKTVEVTPEAD